MNRKTKKILTIIFMFWLVLRLPLFYIYCFFSFLYIFTCIYYLQLFLLHGILILIFFTLLFNIDLNHFIILCVTLVFESVK